ncbi:hypothetical protein ACH429_06340 [Streptomyces pathocidini]|uniref:Uncharacterized protein n=1 Tax=Streptomyces pathocidini TaxID=1650571 RepID=A0ABW7UM63_9ACTN|nr:hypothetical protein [Streptomyces pathocidini]
MPRAARTLGFEFLGADPESGTIDLAFTATEDYRTSRGGSSELDVSITASQGP